MELDEAQQKLAAQRQRVVDLLSGAVAEMNLLSSCLDLARGGDFVEATSIAKSARGTAHHAANDAAAARKRLRGAAATLRDRLARARTLTRERRAYVGRLRKARADCRVPVDPGNALAKAAPDVTAKACLRRVRAAQRREGENDGPLTFAAIGVEVVGVDGPRSLPGAVATFAGDAAFGNRLAALSRDLLETVTREILDTPPPAAAATLVDHVVVRVLDRSSALFVPPRHVIHLRLEEARETAPGGVFAAAARLALCRALRAHAAARAAGAAPPQIVPDVVALYRHVLPRVALVERVRAAPSPEVAAAAVRRCRWALAPDALLCPGPPPGAAPGEPPFDRASYE